MMIVGIKPHKRSLAQKFIKHAAPFMSAQDNDGLGYIAADGDSISGERWLKNADAFRDRKLYTPDQNKLVQIFQHAISHTFVKYNKFGEGSMDSATSILLHTRMATCSKSMENTHPFVKGDTALIHNGVISNSDEVMRKYKRISTCDSEAILQEYLNKGVNLDPNNVQKMADELDGWYAVGIVSKDATGRQIVDVFKCGDSSLYVAFVPALETFVFCTQIGILKSTARKCGLAVTAYDTVEHGVLMRFDAVTGERISLTDFVPEPKPKVTSITAASGMFKRRYDDRLAKDIKIAAGDDFVNPYDDDLDKRYMKDEEEYEEYQDFRRNRSRY
jgi:hypothetical protein